MPARPASYRIVETESDGKQAARRDATGSLSWIRSGIGRFSTKRFDYARGPEASSRNFVARGRTPAQGLDLQSFGSVQHSHDRIIGERYRTGVLSVVMQLEDGTAPGFSPVVTDQKSLAAGIGLVAEWKDDRSVRERYQASCLFVEAGQQTRRSPGFSRIVRVQNGSKSRHQTGADSFAFGVRRLVVAHQMG